MPSTSCACAREIAGRGAGGFRLQGIQLAFELFLPIQHLAQFFDGIVAGSRTTDAQLRQAPLFVVDECQRAGAGHRFDAADARGHAGLGNDLEQADVAGTRHMRAAAQFGGEIAHLQHAHAVAVLLAEQRHRAEIERFLVTHVSNFGFVVAAHLRVDHVFDAAQFLARHRLEMREVETQPIRRHQRAFLRDMFAKHLAQRRVQQMRRRMIEHGGLTARAVDARHDLRADAQAVARLPFADMPWNCAAELLRVGHDEAPVGDFQRARVADLAAGFGVERRAIEDHRSASRPAPARPPRAHRAGSRRCCNRRLPALS